MAGSPKQFVHLHVHSQYSLLDGACRTSDLVKRAKELGQSAVAVTDHGCLFGLVDFYQKAVAEGIKPIIGIEAYMAAGPRTDRTATGVKDGGYHLLLLAENLEGYRNLLKLGSIAYTEGFYYKPRIDKEVLKAHCGGLIATSACLGGEIPSAIMADNRKKAKEIAEVYLDIFGPDHFFIELQKHIDEQDRVNPELIDLAAKMGLGTVATNDVHFLLPGDHAPHDALCCIATGKLLSDPQRLIYPTQLYLKSSAEMYAAWDHPRWIEACENTALIAGRCNVELDFKTSYAPAVKIEKEKAVAPSQGKPSTAPPWVLGSTDWYKDFCSHFTLQPYDSLHDDTPGEKVKQQCDRALRELAEAGAVWRYGPPEEGRFTSEHRARLERELKVLADKNISAYFLIVWDFVSEARRRGIPANARGSGVGTMVGYCLGLSNACPVQYGLLFERFTDPDRSEYPDIDIDICQDGRQEIIDYVRQKYGHVAQIITFGTLKARNAIRDVGRVLGVPIPEVDKVCKLVGDKLGTTIQSALDSEPDLRKLYDDNPTHRQMIDTAQRIEGLARHAGVHAAGVIVATRPLSDIVPLYKAPGGTAGDQIVTQWDGPTCEKVGLLKMDFLGLRTLSIIEKAKRLIKATLSQDTIRQTVFASQSESRNQTASTAAHAAQSETANQGAPPSRDTKWDPLDLDRLTYDDPKVFELFRRAETGGVFQFESGGMRNVLAGMKPDRLEDLIAANALFRPGPMDNIADYNDRKHGRKAVPKVHEIVDRHTAETYGVMVYQEQVMQVVHGLGGIPLRAAYTLIKNISKKKEKDINAVRPKFVEGAQSNGLSKDQAEELFGMILKFASYGFNKSHSTGYAITAYQTAYLKTYFPIQYMAAVLTYESVSTDKVVEYVDQCKRVMRPGGQRGIAVRPPDINLSDIGFAVVFDKDEPHDADHGHIRFGLSAVKGVGDKAIGSILDARRAGGPFKGLHDFCERIPPGTVNRATIEALVKCGAFDSLHGVNSRAALVSALESAMSAGQRLAADRASGQLNMFGGGADAASSSSKSQTRNPKSEIALPKTPPWTPAELLKFEKDVLGFYLSSHPMDRHRTLIASLASATCADVDHIAAEVEVVLGGMLTRVKPTVTKHGRNPGQKMAMITLEDSTGPLEAVVFCDAFAIAAPLLVPDRIVFLKGKVDRRRERPSVNVNQVIPIEQATQQLTQEVRIILREDAPVPATDAVPSGGFRAGSSSNGNGDAQPQAAPGNSNGHKYHGRYSHGELERLKELLRQSAMTGRGTAIVVMEAHQTHQVAELRINGLRIAVDPDLRERVAQLLHDDPEKCCILSGSPKLLRGVGATAVKHTGESAVVNRLSRHTAADEFCDSIDRY